MRIRYNQIFVFSLLVLLLATGCKSFQPVTTPALKEMPSSFGNNNEDSSGIGSVNWRQFFGDSLLLKLIDTALEYNQDIQIAWQRIEAAKATLLRNNGALLPKVNAQISAGLDKYGKYTMSGVGNFDTNLSGNINDKQRVTQPIVQDYFVGLRSNWEIDIWDRLKNARDAAATRVLASQKGRQFVITNLVADIAGSYYNLLALDNQLKIIQRNIKFQQNALDIVKIMQETGRSTALAVQQFQAQLYNTQSVEYDTKQQIVAIESHINFLLGRYPQPIERDSSTLQEALPDIVKAGVPADMVMRRPDVQQAALELKASRFDVAAAIAAAKPALIISPYLGLNAFKGNLLLSGASATYGLLGGLTAPVFNKKEIEANYQIAGAAQKEAFFRYQQALLNSFNEVFVDLKNIGNRQHIQEIKGKEVAELRNSVTSANELYIAGYASYLEVITAQRSVLQAEFELNDNRKEILISLVQLYRSLGGGWQ